MALRAIHPDDAEAVYALVDQSREHLRAWLPWVDASRSAVYTREFFEHVVEQRVRKGYRNVERALQMCIRDRYRCWLRR